MIVKNIFKSVLFFTFFGLFSVTILAEDDILLKISQVIKYENRMANLAMERGDTIGYCKHFKQLYKLLRYVEDHVNKENVDEETLKEYEESINESRIKLKQICGIRREKGID